MEQKHRGRAQYMNRRNISRRVAVSPCPFCGTTVLTTVSNKDIRFFYCPGCGAKITFMDADPEEALQLWEERDEL